jgi:hypothetical protein
LTQLMTKFLSLDKCLPRRQYLQVINTSSPLLGDNDDKHLHYDLHWLAILKKTHHWTHDTWNNIYDPDISQVHISEEDIDDIRSRLMEQSKLNEKEILRDPTVIPSNFCMTVQPHGSMGSDIKVNRGQMVGNPQTDQILSILGLDHRITTPFIYKNEINSHQNNGKGNFDDSNEINLESDSEGSNAAVEAANTTSTKGHEIEEERLEIDKVNEGSSAGALEGVDKLDKTLSADENEIMLD